MLSLKTRYEYVSEWAKDSFSTFAKGGVVQYHRYKQQRPYNLLIMVDETDNELMLKFSGKILLDDYPRLISQETIMLCFEEINRTGLIKVDGKAILEDSEVTACDVTKDVYLPGFAKVRRNIKQSRSSNDRWCAKAWINGGLSLEKVVTTRECQQRLILYDKAKELRLKKNGMFLQMLHDRDSLEQYFTDKVRFEENIYTEEGIRDLLDVADTRLTTVLASKANPILTVFDEAVEIREYPGATSKLNLRDAEHLAFMAACDYDMEQIEAKVRFHSSPKTHIKRAMEPYYRLMATLEADTGYDTESLRHVRSLLL